MLGKPFRLKAVFFDMDGVLFNSMPQHAEAWIKVFRENGLDLPEFEPYLNEGSTALYTVKKMYRKYLGQEVTVELTEKIREQKHSEMALLPEPEVMEPMPALLAEIKKSGIDCWVVTGSAQEVLLQRIEKEYGKILEREKTVSGLDVHHGKPHPEPYLKALQKSGYKASESMVVENAPLGVQSAKAAGLFTIALNTGPLDPQILKDAGADVVFSGAKEFADKWPELSGILAADCLNGGRKSS
ncbi:MAG: HAD-IA family hydrolase [Prolixibacteraceae bacterium]|nr:HAD-IA family hydrolase [Prolixibacteraceae bacterium]